MKKSILFAALIGLSAPVVSAQSTDRTAMEIAQSQNACGGGTIISARFLENGQVGVQCSGGAVASNCIPIAAAAADESELQALQIAQAQNACGDRNIAAAQFTGDGQVRVQCASVAAAGQLCPAGTVLAGNATATAGAAATTASFVPALGTIAFVAVLGALASGNESSTSDTR